MNNSFTSGSLTLASHLAFPAGHRTTGLPALILCHGFPLGPLDARQSGGTFPELMDRIANELGWAAFTFTFRGCGQSSGDFSLQGWIDDLRAAIRRSVIQRDPARTRALRAELRSAEKAWEQALSNLADEAEAESAERIGSMLPVREQAHHALTLLTVPAAPKLIVEVHTAFLGASAAGLAAAKLTHLRRDEERSFRTARHSRPYYLCSALTGDHLAAARGLLAVSTWPLERRIVGPLSPRVDFLTAAIRWARRAPCRATPSRARFTWVNTSTPGSRICRTRRFARSRRRCC